MFSKLLHNCSTSRRRLVDLNQKKIWHAYLYFCPCQYLITSVHDSIYNLQLCSSSGLTVFLAPLPTIRPGPRLRLKTNLTNWWERKKLSFFNPLCLSKKSKERPENWVDCEYTNAIWFVSIAKRSSARAAGWCNFKHSFSFLHFFSFWIVWS